MLCLFMYEYVGSRKIPVDLINTYIYIYIKICNFLHMYLNEATSYIIYFDKFMQQERLSCNFYAIINLSKYSFICPYKQQ